MVRRFLQAAALAAAVAVSSGWMARAEGPLTPVPDPVASAPTVPMPPAAAPVPPAPVARNMFYNYYAPGGPGCLPAGLYPSPRPVPPVVGQTYITYQPLMPHEFLYQHHRVYDRFHPDGTWTTTRIRWNHWPSLPPMFSHLDKPY